MRLTRAFLLTLMLLCAVVPVSSQELPTATATSTPTSSPTATIILPPTPTPIGNWVRSGLVGAYVRSGPGVRFPVVGEVVNGTVIQTVGRDLEKSWILIRYGEGFAWISRLLVQWSDDLDQLPILRIGALTPSATSTLTPTASRTPTFTPSNTVTARVTPSSTVTATVTPSNTSTSTVTPSNTVTATVTPSNTVTATVTPSSTSTATVTPSNTVTATVTPSNTVTATLTPSNTVTATLTSSSTVTATVTPSNTVMATLTPSNTSTAIPTTTHTLTPSHTAVENILVASPEVTVIPPTVTVTNSSTVTSTLVPTEIATVVPTQTTAPIIAAGESTALPILTPTLTPLPLEQPLTPVIETGAGNSSVRVEAIVAGVLILAVIVYVVLYWRAMTILERYADGFLIETCPICKTGKLQIQTRVERFWGIPRTQSVVTCDNCRSVLREVGLRRWRYAVDGVANSLLHNQLNGRVIEESRIANLAVWDQNLSDDIHKFGDERA